MKIDDFIKAFHGMSAEDQANIRAELLPKASEKECCSGSEKQELADMMRKMDTSKNPMAMCMEMMQMCQQKFSSEKTCHG